MRNSENAPPHLGVTNDTPGPYFKRMPPLPRRSEAICGCLNMSVSNLSYICLKNIQNMNAIDGFSTIFQLDIVENSTLAGFLLSFFRQLCIHEHERPKTRRRKAGACG